MKLLFILMFSVILPISEQAQAYSEDKGTLSIQLDDIQTKKGGKIFHNLFNQKDKHSEAMLVFKKIDINKSLKPDGECDSKSSFIFSSLYNTQSFCYFCKPKILSKAKIMTFDVLIEIPKGSRNKYEYDFDIKRIRFDRMLHTSMMYPADYGFVPETLALDNDPIDVLVLFTNPVVPGLVAEVRPVGVLNMSDEKGPDEKIICVPVSDPMGESVLKFSDLNPHTIKEIEHFFRTYKDLENKEVNIGEWGDEAEAEELVNKAITRYKESDTKTNNFSI